MKKILVLQHISFESPGFIAQWAAQKGYLLDCVHLYKDQQIPDNKGYDFLIVMGGPMGVHDEKVYPWLEVEKKFILKNINQGTKILGICLGAQLIASILGAKVYKNHYSEIGWMPVSLTSLGRMSALTRGLAEEFPVFHWHGDTFDLPRGAELLMSSRGCKNQAYLVDNRILGLQFHFEITEEIVASLLETFGPELEKENQSNSSQAPYVQSPGYIIEGNRHIQGVNTMLAGILDRFFG